MSDLIKRLRDAADGPYDMTPICAELLEAITRIEALEDRNKELTLQLLATSGQAADALDKLAKVVERLETMDDYNNYISYAIWATRNELGGKND